MRHLRVLVPLAALAALAGGGCSARTSNVLGRPVTLVPREDGAPKAKGELLAVDQGRIWVRTKEGVQDFDPASLREVRVRRHNLTGAWAVRWGLVGGLASGVAMAAACGSVEGNSGSGCARTGAIWGGVWVLAGLLAAPSLDGSSQITIDPRSDRLKPYARLPAGLPQGASPQSLVQGPPAPRQDASGGAIAAERSARPTSPAPSPAAGPSGGTPPPGRRAPSSPGGTPRSRRTP